MVETAETAPNIVEDIHIEKYLVFSILDRQYAFPSKIIGEVAMFDAVYPLPLVPAYVPGVINRYSIPYALFDISLMLFKTPSSRNKVLVLKDSIDRVAFLINDVTGIADVPEESLLEVERGAESGGMAELVSASFRWNESDVLVLDIQRILACTAHEAAA